MRILLFGSTGMIGKGVLREALRDDDVSEVLAVGRSKTGQTHPKLRELQHDDFSDYAAVEERLAGYDACLFCLGVSSAGMTQARYEEITYGFTLAAARSLVKRTPEMTFLYVSGAGTDSSERGRSMWARVKGKTENALLGLPFRASYMFRPGFIQPRHGIVSRTPSYRILYAIVAPLFPLLERLAPRHLLTTETLGRAMLAAAKHGAPERVLEPPDINRLVALSRSRGV